MPKSVKVVEGEQASVTCKAKGKPKPTFKWIKVSNQKDLSSADRFSVNDLTGVLTITKVTQEDSGDIKCVASNAAGTVEQTVMLTVVLKPKIVTFANASMPLDKEVAMKCSASGMPRPTVTFRKLTSQSRYGVGVQPGDDRIVVTNDIDETRNEVVGTLTISHILRTDDGLYECIATNEGGTAIKMGHFTVQFPPSFANTPVRDVWSWDRNPVNLTCLAEAIPNATITWRLNNRELEQIRDRNIVQFGNQSLSYITVTPVSEQYYGAYSCLARNFLGRAETTITLRQARPPAGILQSKLDVVTATTITFSFVGPAETGGLDLRAYAVQYKEERQDWNNALNKTWGFESPYILEGLRPKTTYNFRFSAKNDAGFGPWGAPQHLTMPERSTPEEPKFFHAAMDGIVHSAYFNQFELQWRIPPDNGEPIDVYDIKYCPARRVNDVWTESGECKSVERKFEDSTSFLLSGLQSDTYYKVELRAHNNIGYSKPGQIVIKTAMDPSSRGTDSLVSTSSSGLSSGVIVAIIVAALLLIFVIIDLSCYCVNKSGILMLVCEKTCRSKQEDEDAKLGREEKEPLNDGTKQPVIDPILKRDTAVEYDVKRSISRTSFVGKDSAV
ncbi:fasciclin-2-like [Bacillus rossius redtenbacheri]|uniref:fasciclin-2-like n=1 Tax=Bacillus rossius redtenbacheri TaxID=93214 RepID=UPI002FDE6CEF